MFGFRTLFQITVFSAALTCLASCGPTQAYSGAGAAPRVEVVVSVTNHNWSDVKVYAVSGSSKFRLGSVPSFTTARLRLPSSITSASNLRLRVELIGSHESYTTEVLHIVGQERMDWVITSHLPLSRLAIR